MVGYFIKDIPQHEKPRERFISKGANSLSDVEILALVIRTGSRNRSVLDVSSHLLSEFGSIKNISDATYEQLEQFDGLSRAKVLSLMGAFELSNRAINVDKPKSVKTPRDVFNLTRGLFSGEGREKLVVLSLDSRNNCISMDIVSKGTVNSTLVHPREIFRQALLRNAVSIILVHNHPSQESNPSTEDLILTEKVSKAGELFEMSVIDHVIVTDSDYASIRALDLFTTKKLNRKEVKK